MPVDPDRYYRFAPQRGPQPCVAEAPGAIYGRSLADLEAEAFEDARSLRDAKRVLRVAHRCLPRWPGPEIPRGHARLRRRESLSGEQLVSIHLPGASGIALGVNIDHVATLRQARRALNIPTPCTRRCSPSKRAPTASRCICARTAGTSRTATSRRCARLLQTRMNLEMAVTEEMIGIARQVQPQDCCLVPESRREITTEGGLDVAGQSDADRRRVSGARRRGNPRLSVHRSGCRADRGRQTRRRAGDRIAHRRLCGCRRGLPGRASSSGSVPRPSSPPRSD